MHDAGVLRDAPQSRKRSLNRSDGQTGRQECLVFVARRRRLCRRARTDGFHQVLEAVVPLGGRLKEEHDALVSEAKLQMADLSDVLDEVLGIFESRWLPSRGSSGHASARGGSSHVRLFKDDLTHGNEAVLPRPWRVRRSPSSCRVFPPRRQDGGHIFADVRRHGAS